MTAIAQTILLMMAVLAAVAVAAKRLHVAPSILLVVAGVGMALIPGLAYMAYRKPGKVHENRTLDRLKGNYQRALRSLLANPRRVLTREKILQQVWGLEYLGESRTIDAHVRRVRAKIGEAAAEFIETVVGVGYRLGGPADS